MVAEHHRNGPKMLTESGRETPEKIVRTTVCAGHPTNSPEKGLQHCQGLHSHPNRGCSHLIHLAGGTEVYYAGL